MIVARDRLVIAELTHALTTDFDVSSMLDSVALGARDRYAAISAVVVVLDTRHQTDDTGIQVVAEALREPTHADLGFLTTGPGLDSARDGAVTMIADLTDAHDTRWPDYRRAALEAGMRGMRAFPVTVLGAPLGALVIHTDNPWGTARSNDLGQILANLTAIALSIRPRAGQRRTDTSDTIAALLQGTVQIATATGLIAELTESSVADARHRLHRLARAHGVTVTVHAAAVLAAYDEDPRRIRHSRLLSPPAVLRPPPHIDT
ncbi:hypothetical protein M1247_01445 [Mycobacterium sp. 21AC1]|uniref:GAF domain-containing protein n=1 Tax=[Mycobacterium] appelbergii TaxID=2939269 RepID=UPI002938E9E3|nr:GAF domain-containing protein [Mycobacterium sp. 21AC1]MDV3123566.1 hypothetical protein [Mycobacterium sp. 21AC1]